MKLRIQIALILLTLLSGGAFAAPVSVKAKLDSTSILMGNVVMLRLEAVQDKGVPGGFPILSHPSPDGLIRLCGDTVELRSAFKRDTVDLGSNRIQINYEVPVQVFDSGFYQLPKFEYISGRDTAFSNTVSLKVIPVKVEDNAQISDYQGVAEPAETKWTDKMPDWLLDYWWIIVAILLLIGLTVWGLVRYRSTGSILPKAPEPDPWVVATHELKALKNAGYWENGQEKLYFTRLTEILRVYLDKRFGINAMEMTSRQIKDALQSNPETKDKKTYISQILEVADFVKFAKVRPLPNDNIAAWDNAMHFVEETTPAPADTEEKGKEGKGK